MAKRPLTLSARWTRRRGEGISPLNREPGDLLYEWGDGCAKADGALLHYVLAAKNYDSAKREWQRSFLEELHARGYDLTTLRFSVRKWESARTGDAVVTGP